MSTDLHVTGREWRFQVRRRLRLMVGLSAAVLLIPAALAGAGDRRDVRGGVAFVNLTADAVPIDPALNFLSLGWQIEYVTCALLVNYPDVNAPGGARLQPEVAKSIDVSADGTTYSFELRDDFRFSPPSNQPVTADAFKRALDRVRDPAMNSPAAPFFHDLSSISSDGAERLVSRLARPAGDFLTRLAMPFDCAVPPDTPSSAQQQPLPSAGPYYISNYTPGARLVLSRNPNYDRDRPANLDQILYQLNVPPAVSLTEIEDGTADYAADGLPVDAYARLAHDFPAQFFVN